MDANDRVGSIYITPSVKMTDEEINNVFGEPTEIVDDSLLGPVKVYNSKKNNGFQIAIGSSNNTPNFTNRPEGNRFN
ncbi:hypothetical protein [Macrococcus armenti]|uniref:hypothetical protein n=1 Tax=Macrococcus armenti TaxID=2875764 RepID=UPI001CCDB918|nr:hypothetical protein [Macrococcus armenti]UBH13534.1 hypothetical protein LAU43_02255 [Macrococcus armenti]